MSDFLLLVDRDAPSPTRLPHSFLSQLCRVPGFPEGERQESLAHGAYAVLFNPHAGATLSEHRLALGDVGLMPVVEAVLARDRVELGTDRVGSRPVWFYHDAHRFVASSSQFCVSALLEQLDLSRDAVAWLLASGYVGHAAYDRRVRRLPGATSLTLDRRDWSVSLVEAREPPAPRGRADAAEVAALVEGVIDRIRVPSSPVLVPISGGADSRVLLATMAARHGARVLPVTWGARDAFCTRKHDAAVARAVCERLGLPFTYLEELDDWHEPHRHFAQFIAYSGGAVDHLHMQRLRPVVARWCADRGVSLMIRGDEAFGWRSVRSESQCRHSVGLLLASELAPAWPELDAIWNAQTVPETFRRRPGESIGGYRDRLYREVRCAGLLAQLNGGFARHCEVVNPFLDPEIVAFFESLPDRCRDGKRAFTQYSKTFFPDIPLAEFGAITETDAILARAEVQAFLRDKLQTGEAAELFGQAICDRLVSHLEVSDASPESGRLAQRLRREIIYRIGKDRLRRLLAFAPARAAVSARRMALRMVIALEATRRIRELQSMRADAGVAGLGGAGAPAELRSGSW